MYEGVVFLEAANGESKMSEVVDLGLARCDVDYCRNVCVCSETPIVLTVAVASAGSSPPNGTFVGDGKNCANCRSSYWPISW